MNDEDKIAFSVNLTALCPLADDPLLVELLVNGTVVDSCKATNKHVLKTVFNDEVEATHKVTIRISGKTNKHTEMDNTFINVIKSAEIDLNEFTFNDYDINEILKNNAKITHDGNGYDEMKEYNYNKCVGFNSDTTFTFTTPLYKWLIENIAE